jgi:hypothetical protein
VSPTLVFHPRLTLLPVSIGFFHRAVPAVLLGRKDETVLEAWPFGRVSAARDVDEVGHVRVGGREAAVERQEPSVVSAR